MNRHVAVSTIVLALFSTAMLFQNCGSEVNEKSNDPLASSSTWLRGSYVTSTTTSNGTVDLTTDPLLAFSNAMQPQKLEEITAVDLQSLSEDTSDAMLSTESPDNNSSTPKELAIYQDGSAKSIGFDGLLQIYAYQVAPKSVVNLADLDSCSANASGELKLWDIEITDTNNGLFQGVLAAISGTCPPEMSGLIECFALIGNTKDGKSIQMFYEMSPGGCASFAK